MTPTERLRAARRAGYESRHDEALSEFIWFHHHALEVDPGLAGARLSFAISYWLDLGASYPAALDALRGIRDDKTTRIRQGAGSLDLFRDVCAINDAFALGDETYLLFKELARIDPELARQCADLTLPVVVDMSDPETAPVDDLPVEVYPLG